MQRVVKPRTQRVKRVLEHREPKLVENTKTAMFIRGGHTSETVTQALKDLYALKKPDAVMFKRKNMARPFEDGTSIEFLGQKSDASLFLFGSHSKKRPHNLVIGRLFDHHILDMIELGIEKCKSIRDFKTSGCALGSKPCLLFTGDLFETDSQYSRLKNLLIDFFRGPVVSKIQLAGLDHVTCCVAVEGKIFFRNYQINLKKSGGRCPHIQLEEMGPSLDLVLRRTHLAPPQIYRQACRQPKATKPKKVKNVSRDVFGSKLGRVHMQRQDLDRLQIRKIKGLKRPRDQQDSSTGTHTKKTKHES